MKYERLTKKICGYYHGKRFVGGKGVINDGKYYRGCFDATAIVDRLGELEDKIERGELVEVPKGAVVLTPEERGAEMRLCNEERKQTVKEFAERVKMAFYYEFDELIPSIMADKIDELVEDCAK